MHSRPRVWPCRNRMHPLHRTLWRTLVSHAVWHACLLGCCDAEARSHAMPCHDGSGQPITIAHAYICTLFHDPSQYSFLRGRVWGWGEGLHVLLPACHPSAWHKALPRICRISTHTHTRSSACLRLQAKLVPSRMFWDALHAWLHACMHARPHARACVITVPSAWAANDNGQTRAHASGGAACSGRAAAS